MAVKFNEELRFPDAISCWAEGGPTFSNTVATMNSGAEQTNINWTQALAKYKISGAWRTIDESSDQYKISEIINFHRSMFGNAFGFRFKDHSDFRVSKINGRVGKDALGTGKPKYQLYKIYNTGSNFIEYRAIKKPVAGTVKVFRNNIETTALTVDITTGTITFNPDKQALITNITTGLNCVVTTSVSHTFVTGDVIYISDLNGSNSINNNAYQITVLTNTTFRIDGITNTAVVYSGKASKYPQLTESLVWTGEFDVPCKFEDKNLDYKKNNYGYVELGVVNIKEIRT